MSTTSYAGIGSEGEGISIQHCLFNWYERSWQMVLQFALVRNVNNSPLQMALAMCDFISLYSLQLELIWL